MTDENEKTHTLVASSTSGRYALDDATYGHDLTSGEHIAIYLNGCWITGRVEHGSLFYAIDSYGASMGVKSGYYFISDNGGRCGLCVGMKVKRFDE
jgi:Domain of unknown function (DUF5348)